MNIHQKLFKSYSLRISLILLFSLIINIYYLFIKFKKYEQNSRIE